jgi:3-deoxy-D-manno-octulosonic-acid transferase
MALGLRASKVRVTGNLKFDHGVDQAESKLTEIFRERFGISPDAPVVLAASTHSPEEEWVLEAFKQTLGAVSGRSPRLMMAPRHPERFAEVAGLIKKTGLTCARRSESGSAGDRDAEVILLDSIGELRAAYPLADLVFVGGSLIKHGGQSIFEPAAAGKAIVTGPHTANFTAAVAAFLEKDALLQLPPSSEKEIVPALAEAFADLLTNDVRRHTLGENALAVMEQNTGAVDRTLEYLTPLIGHIAGK